MKCPDCGGTGVIHFRNIHVLCRKCKALGFIDDEPKPKKQMTEQEYIQTCNTEQLAEFLHGIVIRAVQATWDGKKPDYPAYLYDWKKWLKEKHEC